MIPWKVQTRVSRPSSLPSRVEELCWHRAPAELLLPHVGAARGGDENAHLRIEVCGRQPVARGSLSRMRSACRTT
eukprot:2241692-Pyramimonas_sp.AAC.1